MKVMNFLSTKILLAIYEKVYETYTTLDRAK